MSSTSEIISAMRDRYSHKADVLLFEVRNDAGFDADRSIDAVVLSTWPSRGLDLQAFEFKASRSDWVRELENPAKADYFFRHVDRFWLVAADPKVIKPDELPTGWGLLVLEKGKLRPKTPAPKLAPAPLTRGILASLLVRAVTPDLEERRRELGIARAEAEQKGREDAKLREPDELRRLRDSLDHLRSRVKEFEAAAGIEIGHPWVGPSPHAMGDAVRRVLRMEVSPPADVAAQVRKRLQAAIESLDEITELQRSIQQEASPS